MARLNKREKIREHVEHLKRAFKTPYPVTVGLVGEKEIGQEAGYRVRGLMYRSGRRIYILLNMRFPLSSVHETLNHEWALAMDWRPESVERMRHSAPRLMLLAPQAQHAAPGKAGHRRPHRIHVHRPAPE